MHTLMRRAALGLLAGLTAMLALLGLSSAAGAATAAPTAPAGHAAAALKWPVTGPGTTGERVYAIQYLLNDQIKAGLATDGIYGSKTTAAVKAFQKKVKLPVDGVVGPMTYPKLVVTLKFKDRNVAVSGAEHNLKFAYGYKTLKVNGYFGPPLVTAVKSFQKKFKLSQTGVIDTTTWNAIINNEK
jgi:peptidoglycan hydrolase-like protein with peptidoglycan-binding domain